MSPNDNAEKIDPAQLFEKLSKERDEDKVKGLAAAASIVEEVGYAKASGVWREVQRMERELDEGFTYDEEGKRERLKIDPGKLTSEDYLRCMEQTLRDFGLLSRDPHSTAFLEAFRKTFEQIFDAVGQEKTAIL